MIFIYAMLQNSPFFLIDFNKKMTVADWTVVDDVVMGGRSSGSMFISEAGHAVFTGRISLENNGGFSSVRKRMTKASVQGATHFVIRLKGDGKPYQFRIKSSRMDWHSYVFNFDTSGEWQTIEIPMTEMYPTFRGQKLDKNNFSGTEVSEIGFLIGNKKNENFRLEIDYISTR